MTFPWRKLFQSIQDDIEGLGDAVFGDRTERLLDDEIRGVDERLHDARNRHAAAKARRIDAQQHAQQLKGDLRDAEAEVEAQLKRRRTSAARDAAGIVVRLQARLAELQADANEMDAQEAKFAQLQSQLEHRLRRLKHQLTSCARPTACSAHRRPWRDASPATRCIRNRRSPPLHA